MPVLVSLRRFGSRLLLAAALMLMLPAAMAAAPVVLVLGDSLSAAYNMDREDGWVHLLQERLAADYPEQGWTVVNASITGDTTRGGLSRLPALLAEHPVELLVVALGGNDGLRGLPPAEIRNNLDTMIAQAEARGASTLLAGVRIPMNYGAAYRRLFEAVFVEVAEARQVPLVPSLLADVEQRPELFQPDGIHPAEAAQPLILETVWPALRPLLGD